jgi:glycine reductase
MTMLRVVHYVNQHFGGIGGEDKAHVGCHSLNGTVGPGRVIQAAFREQAEVVGTIICGDNYFAEDIDRASAEVVSLIRPYQPDLVLAGPAFNAGRYGIACAAVSKAVQAQLCIPAVTGMYEENPGLELCREDVYVIKTTDSVRGMSEAIPKMVRLGCRLIAREKIGAPSAEGYFSRGALVNELSELNGAERVVDMLLRKLRGEPFVSEVPRPAYDRVSPAAAIPDMRSATIALVTDGGLVPKGNPDRIEIRTATRFGRYDIKGVTTLSPDDYEVSHEGYDSLLIRRDPNRLVPVDTVREIEREGGVGKLYDRFYSTTGVASIVGIVKRLGQTIAQELKADGVSGVILTST